MAVEASPRSRAGAGRGGPRPARAALWGDGGWIALWPLSMAVGIWGTALLYRALMDGAPGLVPGLLLCVGGLWLTGRWVAQARRLQRAWRQRRTQGPPQITPRPGE